MIWHVSGLKDRIREHLKTNHPLQLYFFSFKQESGDLSGRRLHKAPEFLLLFLFDPPHRHGQHHTEGKGAAQLHL